MESEGSDERRERSAEDAGGQRRGRERLPSVRIENDLRRRLLAHEFAPNERLSLRKLASEYSELHWGAGPSGRVSHETVRRAVLRLAKEQLVELVPNFGLFPLAGDRCDTR
jgi:DNA-binding GntR family transcriptional regulator